MVSVSFALNRKKPDVDPCKTCPFPKPQILRALCLRGHISAAHRLALESPTKDITGLVQDGGVIQNKGQ